MKCLIHKARLAGLSLLLLVFSSPLFALPVTVLTVGADWTNVTIPEGGIDTVQYFDNDGIAGNEEIQFGDPASNAGPSGYLFEGAAPGEFVVETGDIFSLGDFTHTNQPVWNSITGAQLNITTDLMINGVLLGEGPFSFSFLHNETTNACDTAADPDCANDLVSFSSLETSDSFFVDGIEYTLDLIGFSVDGVFTTEFSTIEGQINTAQLLGTFTTTESVPAPPAFVLLALGLVGVALSRRSPHTAI